MEVKNEKAWVTGDELKAARNTVMQVHKLHILIAEKYLDILTDSCLQRFDLERRCYLTTEAGARLIRRLGTFYGPTILKIHEAVHGVPDFKNLPWS
jgi:hypothetical protein